METTKTAATFDAQAPGIADRVKTCASAICAEEGGPGEGVAWLRIAARLVGAGSEDPAAVGPTSVSEMTARLH
jgi:hypothetical protein